MEFQMQFLAQNNKGGDKKRARRSSAKVPRKIIEKNRRNHMKNLYSKLNSLLPQHDSKEPLSLPDQIDEAVSYIKSLKTKLNEYKERKRSYACTNYTETETSISLKSPELKINLQGSDMEVVLTTGTDSQFMFHDMICILNQHGAELLNASFSVVGDTVFHVVHAEIGAFVGSQIIKNKLNKLVYGSNCEDELQQELWNFEIHPETWDLNYEIYPQSWDFPIM